MRCIIRGCGQLLPTIKLMRRAIRRFEGRLVYDVCEASVGGEQYEAKLCDAHYKPIAAKLDARIESWREEWAKTLQQRLVEYRRRHDPG